MNKRNYLLRLFELASILISVVFLTGCVNLFYDNNAVICHRIDMPPAGKSLINFHRPSSWTHFVVPIFTIDGDLVGVLKEDSEFQYVCDPGEHVLVGFCDTPLQYKGLIYGPGDVVGKITVLKAVVDTNKTYDVLAEIAPPLSLPGAYFLPITKDSKRRLEISKFEKREGSVSSGLQKTPDYDNYRQKQQPRIAQVKNDFLSGSKSNQLQYLKPEDSR